MYRVVQKNSCMFECSRSLYAHWPRQPMHSQSALTEHVSLNLARFLLLDPVRAWAPVFALRICRVPMHTMSRILLAAHTWVWLIWVCKQESTQAQDSCFWPFQSTMGKNLAARKVNHLVLLIYIDGHKLMLEPNVLVWLMTRQNLTCHKIHSTQMFRHQI